MVFGCSCSLVIAKVDKVVDFALALKPARHPVTVAGKVEILETAAA